MKRLGLALLAALLGYSAQAQIAPAPPSGQSIYAFTDSGQAGAFPGFNNISGRTSVSTALVNGQKTLIFLVVGQSLAANHSGTTLFTPASLLIHNLNIYNGTLYRCADPILGASGALFSWVCRLGQNLITAGDAARVIFIPVAIGGSTSADWGGGGLSGRLQVAANYARLYGWPITAVLWEDGTTDAQLGTSGAAIQANVIRAQNILIGQGFDVPWLIAIESMSVNVTNTTVRTAEVALQNSSAKRFAGPDTDTLTGITYRSDGTHWTDTGLATVAGSGYWQSFIEARGF